MAQSGETKSEKVFLWISPNPAGNRELVEATAREFKLAMRYCDYGELFERLRTTPCELIGIELDSNPGQALGLIKDLHSRLPHVTIFAASSDGSDGMIRAALEGGASDVLSVPLNRIELHKALIKFTQVEAKAGPARAIVGEVFTFCGARGGLGVTTVAVNVAVRLAALSDAEVALVDLDLQRGDVAAFLNLTPLQSLATIAAAHGELDALFLRATLTRHNSGVFVLPAPPQIEDVDTIGHGEIDRTLGLLRTQLRYTVIDTPRTISGATLAAFEQSDRILVLSDLSVPGVRAAQRTFELLGRLGIPPDRAQLLVTEAHPGPVTLQDAVRAIGKSPWLTVPREPAAANHAMNAGMPLNGDKASDLTLAINDLVARLTGTQSAAAKRGPLLQRIFSRGAKA